MSRPYYWSRMAQDFYKYVERSPYFRWSRPRPARQELIQLFPPDWILQSDVMDSLHSLPETKSGNHVVIIMTRRFSDLVRTNPNMNTAAAHFAEIVRTHDWCPMWYAIVSWPTMFHSSEADTSLSHESRLKHSYWWQPPTNHAQADRRNDVTIR